MSIRVVLSLDNHYYIGYYLLGDDWHMAYEADVL